MWCVTLAKDCEPHYFNDVENVIKFLVKRKEDAENGWIEEIVPED